MDELQARIRRDIHRLKPERVLEVGGIDRPLLRKGEGFAYHGLDIEARAGCNDVYDDYVVQSIEDPVRGVYDMVVSITLLEHVPDNVRSVKSMFDCLKPGIGVTHHYVPAKWHPYSICLRLVGPKWQRRLIPKLRPGTEDVTGYPTFFNHCSVGAMRRLFARTGFTSIDVRPYYHANDYFAWLVPAYVLVSAFERLSERFGWSLFASGLVISAKKP